MYVHTLLSHDKCFEIPTCTDNLNKQILVTGSGFLIDVHGTWTIMFTEMSFNDYSM